MFKPSANHQSYEGFFGRDIISQDSLERAPMKEMPRDKKDYKVYRQYWESEIESTLGILNSGIIKVSANCEGVDPKTGKLHKITPSKEGHMGCGFLAADNYIMQQDPINPEGAVFVPYSMNSANGYFLCMTHYKLLEDGKLDVGAVVAAKCARCLLEALQNIRNLKPDRFLDLRLKK
jgi:hypothetical protein